MSSSRLMEYHNFLQAKCEVAEESGFAIDLSEINPWGITYLTH